MKNIDRMGLVVVLSHLIITLAVLGIYAYSIFAGHEDETLRTILIVIIGYWFGAMGKDVITNNSNNKIERKK